MAKKSIGAVNYAWDEQNQNTKLNYQKPIGELVYLPISQGEEQTGLVLAYKFDIFALQPLSRDYVYIDAENGLVIKKEPILKHIEARSSGDSSLNQAKTHFDNLNRATGNAATRYSGLQEIQTSLSTQGYVLADNSRGVDIHTYNLNNRTDYQNLTHFVDDDNNWTAAEFDNAKKDNGALDVHWGVTKTFDYFKDTFNRDSYDNQGAQLISLVHYSNSYENAAWAGSLMIYGDGGTNFDILTSLDVTAHELGHAVCQETANLVYERESGALNEAFSDIWAAIVENKYAPDKNAFLIGEDIALRSPGYMRSMANPKLSGNPDTYRGVLWQPATVDDGCVIPIRSGNDYCGVHYNSGVLNHWFYILVNGKSGTNDIQNQYNVTGIGWRDAEQIVYRLETAYVTPNSNYKNVRDYGIQAAIDLFGQNSTQAIATQNAFYAVGLGGKHLTNPDVTAPSTPANLSALNTTGSATTLNWEAATDENGIWGYSILKDNVEIARTPKTNYRVTGLINASTHNFSVKAYDNYNNFSSKSNEVTVTTTSMANPCQTSSAVSSYFNIGNVKLNTINNASNVAIGYEDFAYINTDLQIGETYALEIKPNVDPNYRNIPLSYEIFLDTNNSGSFTAPIASVLPQVGNVSTSITIPTTSTLDQPLRLRIIQAYVNSNETITGCGTFTFGQVEDYSVTVKRTLGVGDVNSNSPKIYPNPVKNRLNVQLYNSSEFTYQILNTLGSVVKNGTSKGEIDVNELKQGVYIIKITQEGTETVHKFLKK